MSLLYSIWAIGTGKTASPDQVEEVHRYIRGIIKDRYNESLVNNFLYYMEVGNPSNSRELFSQKNIDGGLIGGAHLITKFCRYYKFILMNYIEISFTVEEKEIFSDIIIAQLNEIEFESYLKTDTGLKHTFRKKL